MVARARKMQRFFSQPLFVAEQFTGRPGRYVQVADTVAGFQRLIAGDLDEIAEQYFYMAGTVDEVIERSQEGQAA